MVGPNTMLQSSQWIKRNMIGVYSEELGRPLTDAEMRVQRSLEMLQVPDWYRKYSKPNTKFLKNNTPFECRPPTWKSMKGKTRTPKKPRSPKKEQPAGKTQTPTKASTPKAPTSPRKSLNSNYRIVRKAENAKAKDRLSISITPTSSDNESAERKLAARNDGSISEKKSSQSTKPLRGQLVKSHTFPRAQPSRRIENINIVFPADFTPKPPRGSAAAAAAAVVDVPTSPRTHYTLTKNIEVHDSPDSSLQDDWHSMSNSHTSFLFAEVEPCGVTKTVQVFASMGDSEEDDDNSSSSSSSGEEGLPARCSPSPHTRFFNSHKKSIELERIVQKSTQTKRENSLIHDIIEELDRSIAESMRSNRHNNSGASSSNTSQEFVKGMVRALENVSYDDDDDDYERSYDEDSDLAKSTTISFKSYDEDDQEREDSSSPSPTYDDYRRNDDEDERQRQQEEEEEDDDEQEEEVFWVPAKIHELARTSSRLSVLSRGSSRSGFQCTSGRCSPGLSPIKSERAREEWTASVASHRSSRKMSRQLFRIDETGVLGTDSGCYSDRSAAVSSRTPRFSDNQSTSAGSSLSSSPDILADFDGITTDMLIKITSGPPFVPLKSVKV